MFISIIIPTKDEPAIQELVDEINEEIKQNHEIIIVDKSMVTLKIESAKVIPQISMALEMPLLKVFDKQKTILLH